MSLPSALHDALDERLDASVQTAVPVSGGSIANACRLETDARSYFLKWGDADVAHTFPGERAGLNALREVATPLHVPTVVDMALPDDSRPGFLLMEWINAGHKARRFWETLGEGLAELHRSTGDEFGFADDNFIGRLPQSNTWMGNWATFFREQRLEPQVTVARDRGRWQAAWNRPLDRLYRRLPDLLPATPPPSLVHGDLWNGNLMVDAVGTPTLVDPAAYYGHREVDLAMTELFGGFDASFREAYRAAWSLEPGYQTRRELYNLYHRINHLNHFGAGYANGVASTLQSFA
jgi:fructosamine-3-kinase